jgi:hypothetical protein
MVIRAKVMMPQPIKSIQSLLIWCVSPTRHVFIVTEFIRYAVIPDELLTCEVGAQLLMHLLHITITYTVIYITVICTPTVAT